MSRPTRQWPALNRLWRPSFAIGNDSKEGQRCNAPLGLSSFSKTWCWSRRLKGSLHIIGLLLLAMQAAPAQEAPLDQEIWNKSQIFDPKPTVDTTPVTVKVVDVTYRIPRNYLIFMDKIPTLKLTWPGLRPLTEETRKCFGSILQSEQAGCTSFEFGILGSRGPAPGGRAFTNAEMFGNFMRGLEAKQITGPFGYELYEVGPEEARKEVYRKAEGDIFFICLFSGHEDRKRGGVCNDSFRLDDMNHVQFYSRLQHIEHIPEIEARMRQLMASFVVEGESNDIDGLERVDSARD
jgi:hypothetical protein